ncbi:hypothetical protein [Thauera humireducens]|uniref:hypothetical protein n=1 Tax=Thauera humireducens TaxID=1134435 RepID=UPI003C75FEFE
MLLFAGHETTCNLLGNGLYTLLRHPAQWAAIQADLEALPGAVREVLRFDSLVQYTGRRVAADLDWHRPPAAPGRSRHRTDRRGQPRSRALRGARPLRHHPP